MKTIRESAVAVERSASEARASAPGDEAYGSKVLLLVICVLVFMAVATLWWPVHP
ncbi:MAG: hypothetical protein ACJ79R_14045 [Anaeromyxobacteraceae bacterium]